MKNLNKQAFLRLGIFPSLWKNSWIFSKQLSFKCHFIISEILYYKSSVFLFHLFEKIWKLKKNELIKKTLIKVLQTLFCTLNDFFFMHHNSILNRNLRVIPIFFGSIYEHDPLNFAKNNLILLSFAKLKLSLFNTRIPYLNGFLNGIYQKIYNKLMNHKPSITFLIYEHASISK